MPDIESIDNLVEMLESVGETELELGELSKEEIAGYRKKIAALSKKAAKKEAPVETEKEESIETPEEAGLVGGDLTDLLKDIEIGLTL